MNLFRLVLIVLFSVMFSQTLMGDNRISNKRNEFGVNFGWNSLTGIGFQYSRLLTKSNSLMIGHGSGLGGSKYSIRLMKKKNIFNYGVGYTFNSGGKTLEADEKLSEFLYQKIKFKTNQTHSLQFVTGIKLKALLFLQINIGWHQVLSKEPTTILKKYNPYRDEDPPLSFGYFKLPPNDFRSGPIIEISSGFSF